MDKIWDRSLAVVAGMKKKPWMTTPNRLKSNAKKYLNKKSSSVIDLILNTMSLCTLLSRSDSVSENSVLG